MRISYEITILRRSWNTKKKDIEIMKIQFTMRKQFLLSWPRFYFYFLGAFFFFF